MNASNLMMFSPGRIGKLAPKNRLVMPPMVHNYADEDGRATPRYIAHIDRVARGGVGTIIIEATFVRRDGRGFVRELGLHDDAVIPGLRALVDAGHRHGALMGIQLFHGGRQASSLTAGGQPVAPSAIPDPLINELPHELTLAEIGELVAAFGAAAARAKAAGFDFVEIHGAHGYLVAQFLSPFSNKRNDVYGGTPEKRRRFLEEVYGAVRAATGRDFPVTVRLSGEEPLPGGLPLEETVATAQRLEQLGAAALHISCGNYATYAQGVMIPPMAVHDGVLVRLAQRVKTAVAIPVIAVGKLRTPEMVEAVLQNGQADFVALGRSLLADPDWPAKVAAGSSDQVRHCVTCNQGCISRLFEQAPIWCAINPEAGREQAFANLGGGAGRTLLVVGGGPAGMTAAYWAAVAGFKVSLYEAGPRLGGQLWAAAAAPHREDWNLLREHLTREIAHHGVELHLNSKLTPADIERIRPWAVIVATGSEVVRPRIAGAENLAVVTGRDVLEKSAREDGAIVVAGGGCAGAQTAEYLASRGHPVTLIEAMGDIATDVPMDERNLLLQRLHGYAVNILPNTRLLSMEAGGVVVHAPHETRKLPADTVVLCLGSRPVNDLAAVLKERGIRGYIVGDAMRPRRITDAVAEGALAVLDLLEVKLDPAIRQELQPAA
ncbi:MAG TPA: FAD-dependent oxidoreductase [Burkholderiales bacterium]|nr:FAD-dependent oxidoreductase [Burkholderiales bacterium]